MLVVTDGADNSSDIQFKELLDLACQSEVLIHVIGLFGEPMRFGSLLEDSPDVDKLTQLVITGGKAYFPENDAGMQAGVHRHSKGIAPPI